jgi:hypothetical protein
MVFLTAGAGWLALMMRAERTRAGHDAPDTRLGDTDWLLHGPSDPDAIEDEDAPLLAAE